MAKNRNLEKLSSTGAATSKSWMSCTGKLKAENWISRPGVNRQAILTPYRHPKMTPIGALGSWP
ncbi:hypothetical protein, partial [Sulfitobacter sp. 1A12057]|uniref:hypothetical protein n=1 Tax=Sulfitobacter sp. 1A12057 TaxID=3368567 RepID=UPI0037474877